MKNTKPKKVLIDSDVCLDALTGREPFHKNAQYILYLAEKGEIKGHVSSVSFSNMFYLIGKWTSPKKAYVLLSKLRQIVSVAAITASEVDSALADEWHDFEDALQHFAAKSNNCQAIITRNVSDYKKSEVPVYTPAEFLEEHE